MSTPHYKIKNWERFQHYHKPRPLWIKLHRALLDDLDFQALSTRSRALLVMLWLLAAESEDGTIPDVKAIAWRLRTSEREVTIDIATLSHYLEPLYTDSRAILASEEKRREDIPELESGLESANGSAWTGKAMTVTAADHAKLIAVYDERLALAEYPKADLWLQNNPRRKRSNIAAFMANWLERASKSAPKGGGTANVGPNYF